MKALSFLIVVPLAVLLFISGCRDQSPTGSTVGGVSILVIQVTYQNGTAFPNANIYVNEEFKGATKEYGAEIGTRTVVLSDDENTVRVEAKGYTPFQVTSLSGTLDGNQHLTVIMGERRTPLIVTVEDLEGTVAEATVDLYLGKRLLRTGVSDAEGKVLFGKLTDGNYNLKAFKEGYESIQMNIVLAYDSNVPEASVKVLLPQIPQAEVTVLSGETRLPDAEISIYTIEGYNQPNAIPVTMVYTDSQGKAVVKGIFYETEYILLLRREGFTAVTMRKMFTPEDQALEVSMAVEI